MAASFFWGAGEAKKLRDLKHGQPWVGPGHPFSKAASADCP